MTWQVVAIAGETQLDGPGGVQIVSFDGQFVVSAGSLYSSPDGLDWQSVDGAPVSNLLATNGDELITIGRHPAGEGSGWITAVTTDLHTWAHGGIRDRVGDNSVAPLAAASIGDRFVAVGAQGVEAVQSSRPVAWTSMDGQNWTMTTSFDHLPTIPDSGQSDIHLFTVVGGPAGFLAAGFADDEFTAAWTSGDGTDWQRILSPNPEGLASRAFYAGDRYVLLGPGHLLVSSDLVEWSAVPDLEIGDLPGGAVVNREGGVLVALNSLDNRLVLVELDEGFANVRALRIDDLPTIHAQSAVAVGNKVVLVGELNGYAAALVLEWP